MVSVVAGRHVRRRVAGLAGSSPWAARPPERRERPGGRYRWRPAARRQARELRRLDDALPGFLDALARALRSGASLPQAVDEGYQRADPVVRRSLVEVRRAVHLGVGLATALDDWARRCPTPAVRLTVASITLGLEAGGTTAQAIDAVASRVRDRLLLGREVAASTAQARASVTVLVSLPPLAAVLLGGVDGRSVGFLISTPAGWLLVVIAVALDLLGWWWMRILIGRLV